MNRREFASALESRRKALGITYKDMAAATGITPDNIRGVVQGWQFPRKKNMDIIAGFLGYKVHVDGYGGIHLEPTEKGENHGPTDAGIVSRGP